jgi:hypothetical protein
VAKRRSINEAIMNLYVTLPNLALHPTAAGSLSAVRPRVSANVRQRKESSVSLATEFMNSMCLSSIQTCRYRPVCRP